MTENLAISPLKSPTAQKIGFALARVIVPLWVMAGATVKLIERTPANLPNFFFVQPAREAGVDLGILLHTLIGLEFFAVAVMLLVPRLAREMAIFMLSSFVLILIYEMVKGAQSCGCFGTVPIPPPVMLGIDGTLLLAVILLAPAKQAGPIMGKRVLTALGVTVIGFAVSFGMMQSSEPAPAPDNGAANTAANGNGGTPAPAVADCSLPPAQIALPNFWYAEDIETWPGQCWNQLKVFQVIRSLNANIPADIAEGEKIVVLYLRDCDHCEEMFHTYFTGALNVPVIAYEMPTENRPWAMPQNQTAEIVTLGGKPNFWIVTTPLVIRLKDGKVVGAAEGEGYEPLLVDEYAAP